MPTEHFASPEKYRKYRAYTHIHGIPTHAKKVCIGKGKGKCHDVKHSHLGRKKKGKSKRRKKR